MHTSDTGVADGASQRQASGADAARGRMPPLPSKYPVTAGRADRSVPRVPYVHTDDVCPASPRDADGSVASARAVFHTHPGDANSSGDMATTRATPTTRATGCLQGFDRPAGWRFDHTGGFHLQRPAPKPTQLPPRPHRRRASIERRLDGRDGQGLRAAAWKVPPRGGPKGRNEVGREGRVDREGAARVDHRGVDPDRSSRRPETRARRATNHRGELEVPATAADAFRVGHRHGPLGRARRRQRRPGFRLLPDHDALPRASDVLHVPATHAVLLLLHTQ